VRLHKALHEDTDKGWIWALDGQLQSRSTVRLTLRGRSVYCEYRELDRAFVAYYNVRQCDHTIPIHGQRSDEPIPQAGEAPEDYKQWRKIIVISDWYRRALGLVESDLHDNKEFDVGLTQPFFSLWADLRSACQHPEPGVRVSTRVAILGAWLGVAGFLLALLEPLKSHLPYATEGVVAVAGVLGLVSWCAARGPDLSP
jgi:hypothetical protein